VIVCGTKFGRIYLSAFEKPDFPFELAGILASGSERSRACARHYGVPLLHSPEDVPRDVDVACVVIGGAVNGGHGVEISRALLRRGVHVLQEHPLHATELAQCLREANANGVLFRLNTHYVHVAPVRRFIEAAHGLLCRQQPLFVDVMCAFQVLYTVFDILGQTLSGIHPWTITAADPDAHPYQSVTGTFAGVPMTFRLQNELTPAEPDNYTHLFHRITLGAEGGHLTLVNTHGPVQWSTRPHMTPDMAGLVRYGDSRAANLAVPSVETIGPLAGPTYQEILCELWPDAAATALMNLWTDATHGETSTTHVQYHLALTKVAKAVADSCGPVRLLHRTSPELLTASDLGMIP
jgi:thiazolinyl imide reductase